ncbi:MAG TPA: N-acetylmannosamine-6-phosphate 2-epimerase [Bacilli bacterium]
MNEILEQLKGKLIVSCQALEDEPLHGSIFMKQLAVAAVQGGASGIRANSPADIRAIKASVNVPVIGIYKKTYQDSEVYLTVTIEDVEEIVAAGADIIAFDATNRLRPSGQTVQEFIKQVKTFFPDKLLMADVSTLEEGIEAARSGVDIVSTTFAGYTPYTAHIRSFSFELLEGLLNKLNIPIIAEGKINRPAMAASCIECGAFAVVVGSAITRPQLITQSYAEQINKVHSK